MNSVFILIIVVFAGVIGSFGCYWPATSFANDYFTLWNSCKTPSALKEYGEDATNPASYRDIAPDDIKETAPEIRGFARYSRERVLDEWQAGQIVSDKEVEEFGGIDKCFAAETIPDRVWERMQGKTYKANPHIGRNDLRHIRALHWDYDNQMHVGEMICNKAIADRVVRIMRQLFDAKYPIQRMLLPEVYDADDEAQMRDNNSSCFCYRTIASSNTLSKHARGLAIDINTLYNPYVKYRTNGTRFVQPSTAGKYCDRTWDFPYKIDHDDLCFRLFTEAGFEWGGDWARRKDYQHFELIEQ